MIIMIVFTIATRRYVFNIANLLKQQSVYLDVSLHSAILSRLQLKQLSLLLLTAGWHNVLYSRWFEATWNEPAILRIAVEHIL